MIVCIYSCWIRKALDGKKRQTKWGMPSVKKLAAVRAQFTAAGAALPVATAAAMAATVGGTMV